MVIDYGAGKELSYMFIDKTGLLRYATVSEYLPAGSIEYYEYRSGSQFMKLQNDAKRYYYQPPTTAPGDTMYNGEFIINSNKPVRVLASSHFSPHNDCKPLLYRDSNGDYTATRCEYTSGILFPFRDTSRLAVHDLKYSGFMVDSGSAPDGEDYIDVSSSPSAHRSLTAPLTTPQGAVICGMSWFLAMIDGDVSLSQNPFRYFADHQMPTGVGEDQFKQPGLVTEHLKSGSVSYYLIKTPWNKRVLYPDHPYWPSGAGSEMFGQFVLELGYMWAPGLAFTLGKGSTLSLTGWGYTLWVDHWDKYMIS